MGIESHFAYDLFRPGQRELAERVYDACIGEETLLAEAMSGFGKTAAVLSGALSAAEETGTKVVYACRTKRQVHRVVEEISRLQRRHPFNAASMFSKYDYCLLRRQRPVPQESFGWYCSFHVTNNLCSYFLNVPLVASEFEKTVRDTMESAPSHADLLRRSEGIHVCPYEVARMAVVQARMAVVPYHYVFDPRAAPVLFDRVSLERSNTILVVDEAHNLRDFFRGISSASISMDEVEGAAREADVMFMQGAAASTRCFADLLEAELAEGHSWRLDKEALLRRFREEKGTAWLQNLAFELSASSGAAWGAVQAGGRLPSLILRLGEFISRLSSSEKAELVRWNRTLALVDPDPVADLAKHLAGFRSSVLVSATMSPSPVFTRSLGLPESSVSTYAVTSEAEVEVKTMVDRGVTTRYKLRTPQMFSKIADKVAAVVKATESGVGVFAPSYAVLGVVHEMVSQRMADRHSVVEAPRLSSQEAAEVFDSFRESGRSVLFAVQGGRFSEGEDFRDDLMGAVVVVGLSLPPPTPVYFAELASLKRRGEPDPYLMLSRLPALRKAFQAAGRHLRRPGQRGLVVLLDERFGSEAVRELMPSWLGREMDVGDFSPAQLEHVIRAFWAAGDRFPTPS